tara:strand:+ start:763 stop:1617 length:855 start_codon:yes stop_codon:yes gene_type:complete
MKRLIYGLLLCFMIATSQVAWADTTSNGATTNTQTNQSGSNTTISGGYSQESTTTYQSGSSSNSTTTNTTNAYSGDTRVANSASAPSMSAMSQDLCVVGISGGISTVGIGLSGGTYITDENCERIKLSKVLNDLGMKVAAVSILCQDPRVFFAMEQSGTPCPFEGKIGSEASNQWLKYNKLRPDYEIYTKRLKIVQKADKIEEKRLAEEEKKRLEAEKKAEEERLKAIELEKKKLKDELKIDDNKKLDEKSDEKLIDKAEEEEWNKIDDESKKKLEPVIIHKGK